MNIIYNHNTSQNMNNKLKIYTPLFFFKKERKKERKKEKINRSKKGNTKVYSLTRMINIINISKQICIYKIQISQVVSRKKKYIYI